jgi:hypothetical protein
MTDAEQSTKREREEGGERWLIGPRARMGFYRNLETHDPLRGTVIFCCIFEVCRGFVKSQRFPGSDISFKDQISEVYGGFRGLTYLSTSSWPCAGLTARLVRGQFGNLLFHFGQ